jgi:hypothetical protein
MWSGIEYSGVAVRAVAQVDAKPNRAALSLRESKRAGSLSTASPASLGGLACARMVEWYGPTHESGIGNMTVVANQVHDGLMTLPDLWVINHEGEGFVMLQEGVVYRRNRDKMKES